MATAVRRHSIVNPARRRNRVKSKRNRARRHLSAKQVKFFGTPAQKAALKRKRSVKRNVAKKTNRVRHRARAVRRKNPGEILSLTLGNPARKRKNKVAKAKRNRRRVHARRHNPVVHRRRRRRSNPVMRRRRRTNRVRHHRIRHRRNPAISPTNLIMDGVLVIGGMVGSRLLTQMVLGANNVGVWGYAANAAAGAALAALAHMVSKNPRTTNGIIVGTAAGIVARLFQDYTPFGTYLQQAGVGDYAGGGGHGVGLYLPSNAVLPQRYVDAANSAQVVIPYPGWAPTTVIQSSGAGMGSVSDGYAGSASSY